MLAFLYLPPSHNMQHNTGGTFQKHHQGMSVWHLEEEIFAPLQAHLTATIKNGMKVSYLNNKYIRSANSLVWMGAKLHLFLHYLHKNRENPIIKHLLMNMLSNIVHQHLQQLQNQKINAWLNSKPRNRQRSKEIDPSYKVIWSSDLRLRTDDSLQQNSDFFFWPESSMKCKWQLSNTKQIFPKPTSNSP